MNRLSFFIVVLVLMRAAASSALAQTNYPVSIGEQRCIADVAPGQPTLKRRQPAPHKPPVEGGSFNQKRLEGKECKREDSAADSLNQKPIRIEFEGLHALSEVDIVKAFRERLIGLPGTQLPGSEVLGKAVAVIKELLELRGYFHATVDTREDEVAGTLVFLVYEGERLPLAEVRFEGSRSVSSQELSSKMEEYLTHYPKMQGGYDSEILDLCIRRLLNSIRSRGYLRAMFGQPIKEIDQRGLVLIIPVDEGVLYRLGEIKIEGAEAVASEQVRAMLSLRQGDLVNGEEIGKWLFEDLKRVYGEIGHVEFTAEPEPEFKAATNGANEGVVDFKVTIEEGRQFRVHSINFRGSSISGEELLGLLRIRAGDVFNQRLFEESIDELNKLGRFELIDKDRDADFSTDEELGLINIVIKLKNRGSEVESKKLSLNRRQP
jgi:outer membrane protein insertion porin family